MFKQRSEAPWFCQSTNVQPVNLSVDTHRCLFVRVTTLPYVRDVFLVPFQNPPSTCKGKNRWEILPTLHLSGQGGQNGVDPDAVTNPEDRHRYFNEWIDVPKNDAALAKVTPFFLLIPGMFYGVRGTL